MLSVLRIQGNDLAASSSFCSATFVPGHGHVIFEGGQQKCTEFSLFRADSAEGLLFQQMKEKTLRQILCIQGLISAAPGECIKRIPVQPAKFGQRRPRFRSLYVDGV